MITINNESFDISEIMNNYIEGSVERELLDSMSRNEKEYTYDSLDTLKFELSLRKEIVDSAIDLNNSNFSFASFEESRCNEDYWERTDNGGFLLRHNVKPSEAIEDIFVNGDKYATECASAVMVVHYKALLNVYKEEIFNKTFSEIYLMDWDVKEELLKDVTILRESNDRLLGNRQYFSNPDVNPDFPEWEGENVIVLQNNMYYAHGIGIVSADGIVKDLNTRRVQGSTNSAYLLDIETYPDFKKLADVYFSNINNNREMNAEGDTEMNTEVNAEESTEMDREMDIEENTETNTQVNVEESTEMDKEMDAEENTETNIEVNVEENTEMNTEMNAGEDTETNTEVNTEESTEMDIGMNTNTDTNSAKKLGTIVWKPFPEPIISKK